MEQTWQQVPAAGNPRWPPQWRYAVWQQSCSAMGAVRGLWDVRVGDGPVVFVLPGTFSSAEQLFNPPFPLQVAEALETEPCPVGDLAYRKALEADLASLQQRCIAPVLVQHGYRVFSVDYRTHALTAHARQRGSGWPWDVFVGEGLDEQDRARLASMRHWDWDLFVQDVHQAIALVKSSTGVEQVILAGQSFGGMLASHYVTLHSEDVAGVVLLDGGNGAQPNAITPPLAVEAAQRALQHMAPRLVEAVGERALQLLMAVAIQELLYRRGIHAFPQVAQVPATSALDQALQRLLSHVGFPMPKPVAVPHYPAVMQALRAHPLAEAIDPVTKEPLSPLGHQRGDYLGWLAHLAGSGYRSSSMALGENTIMGLAMITGSADWFWPIEVYRDAIATYRVTVPPWPGRGRRLAAAVDVVAEHLAQQDFEAAAVFEATWARQQHVSGLALCYGAWEGPMLLFLSGFGQMAWGHARPRPGLLEGGVYPFLGHLDVYTGSRAYLLVNQPTINWLRHRSLA